MKKGKLVVFSAPSGSGKTTIVKYLLSQNLPLGFSISATSREKRGNETHGKDYYFISSSDFKKHINQNDFVEWEEVYTDHFYGTLKSEIEKVWASGKHVIFDIDVVGGVNIKKQFPEETLSIFVKPPSLEIMEKRLRGRKTESEEKILQRLAKASKEMSYQTQFDEILINDNLEEAQEKALKMVSTFLQ